MINKLYMLHLNRLFSNFIFVLIFLSISLLNSQEKKQVYTKENLRIIKPDSSIHYGKLVLYDDLSSEWIESSKIKTLLSKDSLRNVLREKIKISDVFNEYWSNSRLFPYPDQTFHMMDDSIKINLLEESGFYMVPNEHLFSPFGWRRNRQHKGMDLDLSLIHI